MAVSEHLVGFSNRCVYFNASPRLQDVCSGRRWMKFCRCFRRASGYRLWIRFSVRMACNKQSTDTPDPLVYCCNARHHAMRFNELTWFSMLSSLQAVLRSFQDEPGLVGGAVTIWSHSRQVSVVLPCIMWSDAAASYSLNDMRCSAVRSGSIFSRLVAWSFASKCSARNVCGCRCMKVCLSNRWCRKMNSWYARYVSSNDREIMKVLTKNAGGWSTIVDPAFILIGMFWYTNFKPISSGWNNLSRHCFSCVFLSFCDGSEIWLHGTYSTVSRNLECRHSSPSETGKLHFLVGIASVSDSIPGVSISLDAKLLVSGSVNVMCRVCRRARLALIWIFRSASGANDSAQQHRSGIADDVVIERPIFVGLA